MKLFGKRINIFRRRAECIYGPPEMLRERRHGKKPKENVAEGIYGPPDMLIGNSSKKPENEVPEDIYGPPEMLGAILSDNNTGPTEESIDPPDGEDDDI